MVWCCVPNVREFHKIDMIQNRGRVFDKLVIAFSRCKVIFVVDKFGTGIYVVRYMSRYMYE